MGLAISILQPSQAQTNWWEWNGLVCYYKGDSLEDSSTPQYNLSAEGSGFQYETIQSAPFASSPRNVLSLNGASYASFYLKATIPTLPIGNAARTIMGWYRIDQAPVGWGFLFAYGSYVGDYKMFNFAVNHENGMVFDMGGGLTNNGVMETDHGPYGVWKHYAITWDGSNLLCYVDSVLTYQGTTGVALQSTMTDFFMGVRVFPGSEVVYAAAAEIAMFDRALTQSEITTVFSTATAGGGGDPHLFGFGGVFFTWQGHCDIILTKVTKLNETQPEIEIHARTRRVRQWSAIDSIAFKFGQDVGEIESDGGALVVNGKNTNSFQSDNLTVSFSKLKRKNVLYEIVFENDKLLQVRANTRTKMLYVTLSGNYPEGTVGVLGSPHKPGTFGRDGTAMSGENINDFVETWQVTDSDPKLFQTNRDPQYPSKCLYDMREIKERMHSRQLKEVHATTMEEATAACKDHLPGPLKDFCVEDMLNTGDFDSATDVFYD